MFIILLAIYNCFNIPFVLAFRPEYGEALISFFVDSVIDFLFAIDILINFRTTYIDSLDGEEIFEGKKIAHRYFFSMRFWMDLISTIPFDKMFSSLVDDDAQQFLSALGMLKVFRIGRIGNLI